MKGEQVLTLSNASVKEALEQYLADQLTDDVTLQQWNQTGYGDEVTMTVRFTVDDVVEEPEL